MDSGKKKITLTVETLDSFVSFQGHEPILMKTHGFKLCKKKIDIKGRGRKAGWETNLKYF